MLNLQRLLHDPNNRFNQKKPIISESEAAQEILRRRAARNNFLEFVRYTKPSYQVEWFHKYICDKLEDFANGKIQRLMIFVPPQHGKSELSSRRLPAYLLGKYPNKKVALITYAASLASDFNRDVQRIIDSRLYYNLFPNTLLNESNVVTVADKAKRNSEVFEIVGHEGSFRTVGVGGPLTGKPVDIGIIDDIYKDYEEANSPAIRARNENWYDTVFLLRLHNLSQQLILFTRWHSADLATYILENSKPGDWEVITIPALKEAFTFAEDKRAIGEALWESKHSRDRLIDYQRKNPLKFDCLYQQQPANSSGNKIKTAWFVRISESELKAKINGKIFQNDCFLDGAYTDKTQNDPSALMGCVYFEGILYILDSTAKHLTFPDLVDYAKDYVKRSNIKLKQGIVSCTLRVEPKASGISLRQVLVKNGLNVIDQPAPTVDKTSRVDLILDFLAAGRCVLVEGHWNEQFLKEVGSFPVGKHDDQVDNLTAAIRHYDGNIVKPTGTGSRV